MERNNLNDNEPKITSKMQDLFNNYNSNKTLDSKKLNLERYNSFNDYNKNDNNNNNNDNNNNNYIKNNTEKLDKKFTIQRKNNLLNYNNTFKNMDIYVEPILLYIDDNNTRVSEIIIQNYECKFIFDNEIQLEFLKLVHFTAKYFEFPIFYFFKGFYNDETKITTITLKDYRSFKIKSHNNQILKQLKDFANNTLDLYLYAKNYKKSQDKKNKIYPKNGWELYDPICEYLRQEIEFSDNKFCFSYKNNDYKLCDTYPNILVIPKDFDNDEIFKVASSRMKNRFPILSFYYHKLEITKNENSFPTINKEIKSYLYRSSQIKTGGIIFKSKNLEVEYINRIMNIENNNNGFIVFDCRPAINAKANTLKGAGVEDIKMYKNCQNIIFGCIENIHCVRQSLKKALLKAYYGKESIVKGKISFNIDNSNMKNFLSKFEDTKWLEYISDILIGSITVSNHLIKGINVLVHCSDGWDRTSQICSLVQIILDPFFRTIEGFAILIEKEWISFGHQFATRNGCDFRKEKKKERSPVFVQFLHCVYQMILQYPTAFEFNSNLLLFLCREIYSNKYGNFLFNCEKDLIFYEAKKLTVSIWSDVFLEKNKYLNDLYKKLDEPINIKGEMQYLSIWNDYFFQFDKLGRVTENNYVFDKNEYVTNVVEEKKKSILELLNIIKENGLEGKIKDNKFYKLFKEELK